MPSDKSLVKLLTEKNQTGITFSGTKASERLRLPVRAHPEPPIESISYLLYGPTDNKSSFCAAVIDAPAPRSFLDFGF